MYDNSYKSYSVKLYGASKTVRTQAGKIQFSADVNYRID